MTRFRWSAGECDQQGEAGSLCCSDLYEEDGAGRHLEIRSALGLHMQMPDEIEIDLKPEDMPHHDDPESRGIDEPKGQAARRSTQ